MRSEGPKGCVRGGVRSSPLVNITNCLPPPLRPALKPSTPSLGKMASTAWTQVCTASTPSHRPITAQQCTCSRCTALRSSTPCSLWCLPPGTLQFCPTLKHHWWEPEHFLSLLSLRLETQAHSYFSGELTFVFPPLSRHLSPTVASWMVTAVLETTKAFPTPTESRDVSTASETWAGAGRCRSWSPDNVHFMNVHEMYTTLLALCLQNHRRHNLISYIKCFLMTLTALVTAQQL